MPKSEKKVFKNQHAIDLLASNVYFYRTHCNLTQLELANVVDIDVRQIQRIEYGVTDTKLSVIQALADALCVTISDLVSKR